MINDVPVYRVIYFGRTKGEEDLGSTTRSDISSSHFLRREVENKKG